MHKNAQSWKTLGASVVANLLIFIASTLHASAQQQQNVPFQEEYPEDVLQKLQEYPSRNHFSGIARSTKWKNASTIIVSFENNIQDRYVRINNVQVRLFDYIRDVAREWTKYANLNLKFESSRGVYYRWSRSDAAYRNLRSIRIAFTPKRGFYSVYGTQSVNPLIRRPGVESMNLESFDTHLPWDARRIILHEFGHAIGLVHEHQRRGTRCAFRWYSDPGYKKEFINNDGFLKPDTRGKRPGVLEYYQDRPFNWSYQRIISNISIQAAVVESDGSKYDPKSIMHYTFQDYLLSDKNCAASRGDNMTLSPTDISVVRRNYPFY